MFLVATLWNILECLIIILNPIYKDAIILNKKKFLNEIFMIKFKIDDY